MIGDRIEINGKSGEVSDITILYTTLLEIDTSKSSGQFTGKLLQIQNRHLFTSTIVNFSTMFGMTWEEISFTITYESNWEKTQRELANIVRSTVYDFSLEAEAHISKNRYDFPLMSTDPTFHISPTDYGINIAARFLCPSVSARCTKDKIWLQILVLIENLEQIELAYPTKRVIEEKGNVNTIQLEPINNAKRHAISTKIPKRIAVMYYFPLKSRICGKIIKVQQKQIMFNAKGEEKYGTRIHITRSIISNII